MSPAAISMTTTVDGVVSQVRAFSDRLEVGGREGGEDESLSKSSWSTGREGGGNLLSMGGGRARIDQEACLLYLVLFSLIVAAGG